MTELKYQGTEVLENLKEAVNYNSSLVRLIKRHAPKGANLRVLDFGAGIGTFTDDVRSALGIVDCFEVDPDHVLKLKNKGFVCFSSYDQVRDKEYDFIYALNVFEHIEDDQDAFNQLVTKLKPGGKLFIFVPAFNLLYSSFDKYVGHYRRYKLGMLEKLAKSSDGDFTIEKSAYFDFLGFWAAWAYKIIHKEFAAPNLFQITFFDKALFPMNKIFDRFFCKTLGKNAYIVATSRKPDNT